MRRQGGLYERARLCSCLPSACRDLARLPTAGKTEFFKSEPPLMSKDTDPNHTHQPANQKTGLPWEQRQKQSDEAVLNTRVHTQTAANRAVQGRMYAHAHSPAVRRSVGLRLAGVCERTYVCFPLASSQFSLCSARSPCVHVCVRQTPAGQVPVSP